MTTRQELATAASTVDGVTGHPYVSANTDPGTAFVRLDRVEYPNPFGGVAHWSVVVILPQIDPEQYLEAKLPALKSALDPHLVITSVRPQRIDITGVGVLPCAFINGHREED